jgi:hypothetical protein
MNSFRYRRPVIAQASRVNDFRNRRASAAGPSLVFLACGSRENCFSKS